MADYWYIGTSVTTVAQEDRFTPANVEVSDVFTLTVTGEDGTTNAVSFTSAATTVAGVTAGLAAAWNASTHRLCTPITATDMTTYVRLVADVAGVPFVVAASTTNGGGANTQTLTRTATTPNTSGEDWNYAPNWSNNAVPTSSDTVTLDARMQSSIKYGLNQSAVTIATFKHYRGALAVGTDTAELRISITAGDFNIRPDDGTNQTSGFVRLNTGTNATTLNVWGAGGSLNGVLGFTWKGVHASNKLNVYDGTVGIATAAPGDVATLPTLNVIGSNAKAILATGVTLTTVNLEQDGKAIVRCSATTINVVDSNCQLTTEYSGTAGTINCNGKASLNSTGTITNLNVEDSGDVVTTETNNARTVSNATVYGDGKLTTDLNTTYSTGVDCTQGAETSQVNFGSGVNVASTAA